MTAPLVDARELFAVYPSTAGGVAALQGLTLAVSDAEICVVLGPSGSGKTTFMRALAGLARPSAGSLVVAGVDVLNASARELGRYRREVLGYADQHYWRALEGELTAEELVALPLGLAGVPSAAATSRARELLERVGLLDRADALPRELSGGEQQRIALCAAVAHRPRLLIADEPTGDLDEESAREVLALLSALAEENGSAAILVSHDPASTEIADRVVHIRDGRVSEERSGDLETAVVGAGGWLRIPEEALRAAGIHDRARIVAGEGSVSLHPVDGRAELPSPERARLEGVRGEVLEARGVSHDGTARRSLSTTWMRCSFPGQLAVVVGPSGSGKSTLLALLTGLDVPDEGEVRAGRHRRLAAGPRHASGDSARSHRRRRPGAGALRVPLGPRERRARARATRYRDRTVRSSARPRHSPPSVSPPTQNDASTCCPPASESASLSPASSRRALRSSSPTSRPRDSTPRRRSRSEPCSRTSRTARAPRSSARRTTRSSSVSPTVS